jgi:hypothetical protein
MADSIDSIAESLHDIAESLRGIAELLHAMSGYEWDESVDPETSLCVATRSDRRHIRIIAEIRGEVLTR